MPSKVRFFEHQLLHVAILGKFAHKLDPSFDGKTPRFEIASSRTKMEVAGTLTSLETLEFTRPCDVPPAEAHRYSSVELDDLSSIGFAPRSDILQRAAQLGGELYIRLRRAISNLLPFTAPGFDKLLFSLFEAYLTETEVNRPKQIGEGVIITPQAFDAIFRDDIAARVIKYLRAPDGGALDDADKNFSSTLMSLPENQCSNQTKTKIIESLREFRKTAKDPSTDKTISRLVDPKLYPIRHHLLSAGALKIPTRAIEFDTNNFGGLYRHFLQNQEEALEIARSEPKHALIIMYLFRKLSSDFSIHATAAALTSLYPDGYVHARTPQENEDLFGAYAAALESKYESIAKEAGETSPRALVAKFLRDYAFRVHHKNFNPQNSATREGVLDWILTTLLETSSEVMEGVSSAKAAVDALTEFSADADKSFRVARAAGTLSAQEINSRLSVTLLTAQLTKSFMLLGNPKQTESLSAKLTKSFADSLERWRTELIEAVKKDQPEKEFDKLFQTQLGLAETEIIQAHWDVFGTVVDIDLRGLEFDYLRLTKGAATGADLTLFIPGSSHATPPGLARPKAELPVSEPKSIEEKEAAAKITEQRQQQLRQEAQAVALGSGQPVPGLARDYVGPEDESKMPPVPGFEKLIARKNGVIIFTNPFPPERLAELDEKLGGVVRPAFETMTAEIVKRGERAYARIRDLLVNDELMRSADKAHARSNMTAFLFGELVLGLSDDLSPLGKKDTSLSTLVILSMLANVGADPQYEGDQNEAKLASPTQDLECGVKNVDLSLIWQIAGEADLQAIVKHWQTMAVAYLNIGDYQNEVAEIRKFISFAEKNAQIVKITIVNATAADLESENVAAAAISSGSPLPGVTTIKEQQAFPVVWVTRQAGTNALAILEKLYADARQEQLEAGNSSGTATSWPLFITEDRNAPGQIRELSASSWPRPAILPLLKYLSGNLLKGEKVGSTSADLNQYEPGTKIRSDNDWGDALRFIFAVPRRRATLMRAVVNTNWLNRRLLQPQTDSASKIVGQNIDSWISTVERSLRPYAQDADESPAILSLKKNEESEIVVERNNTEDKLQELKPDQLYVRFSSDKTAYLIY